MSDWIRELPNWLIVTMFIWTMVSLVPIIMFKLLSFICDIFSTLDDWM